MKLAFHLHLTRVWLELQIALWRHGWLPVAATAACVSCAAVWVLWVPMQTREANRSEELLQHARQNPENAVRKDAQPPPLQALKRILLPQTETSSQLRQVFQLATDAQLAISQIEMRRQDDPNGMYSQLQISIPMRGTYPNIKRFCTNLLLSMPAVSIDQLVLKREQPTTAELDAQLALSIWQRPERESNP